MALVGIDIGTQSLKAVVCTDALEVRGEGARPYAVDHPRPDWAEQDPARWEAALGPAIADALAAGGIPAEEVTALGVAGQLDGCVAAGDAGAPLAPCLVWMDRRATDEVPELDAGAFRAKTGLVADATHMAAKIAWLEQATGGRAATYHQPVSYLVARLTGARVMSRGLASTTMLYDLALRRWDSGLCDLFGVRLSTLPDLADAADVAGTLDAAGAALTGLPAGIAVAVGTGDDFATPLGAGLVAPGRVACVLGTAEVVGALSTDAILDPGGLVETHGYPGGTYFVENPGWLAGGAVEWARRLIGAADAAEVSALAAGAPPGAGGVTFVPALSGAMAPQWIAGARAAFYGLSAGHDRGHVARAVLEGCAFAMRDVVDRLDELGVATGAILALGGGAASDVWCRIRADLCGRPVERADRTDTCAVGAAMLAAVAGGAHDDLAACAAQVSSTRPPLAPDPDRRAAYDEAYRRYRRLFDCLRPLY